MKKAIDFFTAHPARFFLLAALLWGGFMCFLNYKDGAEFSWHDLLVEANGMVFDLLVFGILLSIYETLREKRDKIERLHEEIDDYRFWNEKEAMFRIVGAVRRLNKLGVSEINLSHCFLEGANLEGVDLKGANLKGTNLQRAYLQEAKFGEANLDAAHFHGSKLERANFQDANLVATKLQGANLQGANLQGVKFFLTNLGKTNLKNAIVDKDWFKKLEERKVWGKEEIIAKYLVQEDGRLREKRIRQ